MHTYTSSYSNLVISYSSWTDIYLRLEKVNMLNEYLFDEKTIVFGTVGLVREELGDKWARENLKQIKNQK